jgi:hypothetical protein
MGHKSISFNDADFLVRQAGEFIDEGVDPPVCC